MDTISGAPLSPASSTAREGSRNMQLNRSAFALSQIVAAGLLTEAEVLSRLTVVAHQIGLTEREIAPTIQSGLVAGSAYPRTPPRAHGNAQHTQQEIGTRALSKGTAATSSAGSAELRGPRKIGQRGQTSAAKIETSSLLEKRSDAARRFIRTPVSVGR